MFQAKIHMADKLEVAIFNAMQCHASQAALDASKQVKVVQKEVTNIQYAACMNPTAGSFHITPRMQRHFATFAVQMPTESNIRRAIFRILIQQTSAIFQDDADFLKALGLGYQIAFIIECLRWGEDLLQRILYCLPREEHFFNWWNGHFFLESASRISYLRFQTHLRVPACYFPMKMTCSVEVIILHPNHRHMIWGQPCTT
jgi:hypothetical protein